MNAILNPSRFNSSQNPQTPTETAMPSDRPASASFGQSQLSLEQWHFVREQLSLTGRELSVCQLLFDCLTRQQIADQLEISNRTVRHHMEQIHNKLKVKNRVGVVLKIIQQRDLAPMAQPQACHQPEVL